MRILVTGCAGYLGSHLVPALENDGHEVRGVDLLETRRAEDVVADLTEEGVAAELMAGVDVLVHTAAIHPWKQYTDNEYMDTNIKPVHHVLKGGIERGVRRVVYTSSVAAIGYHPKVSELPLEESAPARPDDLYGCTKWFGEVLCQSFSRKSDLETVCIRPPAFMPKPELERGRCLLGMWADVSDVVAAHVAAVAAPMPSKYEPFWSTNPLPYVAEDAQALRDNPRTVIERYWPGAPRWFEERGMSVGPVRVIYDLSRAKEILGWAPRYSFDVWWKEHAEEL